MGEKQIKEHEQNMADQETDTHKCYLNCSMKSPPQ